MEWYINKTISLWISKTTLAHSAIRVQTGSRLFVSLEWQVRVKWPVGTDGAGLEGALINFSCARHSSPPRGDSGKVTAPHVYTPRPSTCLCAALTHNKHLAVTISSVRVIGVCWWTSHLFSTGALWQSCHENHGLSLSQMSSGAQPGCYREG